MWSCTTKIIFYTEKTSVLKRSIRTPQPSPTLWLISFLSFSESSFISSNVVSSGTITDVEGSKYLLKEAYKISSSLSESSRLLVLILKSFARK